MTDSDGFAITRTFAAPRELAFDAWTTPAHFATWFGGSGVEVPVESIVMDARAGSTWTATMILGQGMPDIRWFGEFVEVDRPEKLVMTLADREGDERETLTVFFTESDGGTEMRFRQSGGHLTPEQYERTEAGWQTFFDAMDELLAA